MDLRLPELVSNANFAWLQHILWHLAPNCTAGVVWPMGHATCNVLSNEQSIVMSFDRAIALARSLL